MTSSIPIEKLPDVVLGRDRSFGRAEAIAQLAASLRTDREQLLAQALENTYESRRYRAVAAIALGRIPTPAAEQILLRNATDITDEVLADVLLSLGRIGGRAALEVIDYLKLPARHAAANAAAYAATLLIVRKVMSAGSG